MNGLRWNIVRTVFWKECREMLRDRRSLAIMFGIPLLLYPLMTVLVASIGLAKTRQLTEHPVRLVVNGSQNAPHLMEMMIDPKAGLKITESQDPAADLSRGQLDAIVDIPAHAEADALSEKENPVVVRLDRSRTEALAAERKLDKLFESYEKWIIERRLASRGVEKAVIAPVKHTVTDIATGDQRLGKILSFSLPVLLLVTGMLGAFFPALNATTTERELGTLETLLVTPAGRGELLLAKGSFVLLCGLTTAGLNMFSMALVLWRSLSVMNGEKAMAALTISPSGLVLTYVAAIPTLITFATLVLILGLVARTFREANALATPVMMIPMVSMVIGVAEPALTPGLLITPVANTTLMIREVLTGRATLGAFVLAFASSCVYAGLLLSVAARVFTSEQLVNPGWEPLSMSGLRRGKGTKPRGGVPSIDAAIAIFALSLLLAFYVSPSLASWNMIALLTVVEIGLVAGPAIGLVWAARCSWRDTFSWRWPGALTVVAGALIGAGLAPWIQLLFSLQSQIWPPSPEYLKVTTGLFIEPLARHPILLPILAGLLAGVCEELLYRGPVQAGLLRKLPVWGTLVIGGLLFAGAHLDGHGMMARTLLGVILGWLVIRTNSIFPAMAAHAVYDSVLLGMLAYLVKKLGGDRVLAVATESHGIDWQPLQLAMGTALLIAGWLLLRRPMRSPETKAL